MAMCKLPDRPARPELLSSYSILERACDAAESFFDAFGTVRAARSAKGAATDHEQDLMRAALIFAAAGLDSLVKQLVRDALRLVIAKDKGAQAQYTTYVLSKLRKAEGGDLKFLAEALSAASMGDHLQQSLIYELTGNSLQSKEQLLRVAAHFAIRAEEISDDLAALHAVFLARNQIAHEMDILLGQTNRGRRQRTSKFMKDSATTVLRTAASFYSAVEKRI